MRKLCILFLTMALAIAIAGAATKYNVTLYQPSVVNGTELKPGDYKVEVTGDKATFKLGKTTVEVPVKVEETTQKNDTNAIRYVEGGKLQEIRIGGTHTKLVFSSTPG
jgi:hypothetical protein